MNNKSAKHLLTVFLACSIAGQPLLIYAQPSQGAKVSNEVFAQTLELSFDQAYAVIGKPLKVLVNNAIDNHYTYEWRLNGSLLNNTIDSYTPQQSDLEKILSVTVRTGDGSKATKDILISEIPVIYINTDSGLDITDKDKYVPATMNLQQSSRYGDEQKAIFNGKIEIKGRGNSTWGAPKKPYKLKLSEKTDLFGMGKSKHWVLLANYTDTSLMRNTLAYDLSGDMGMYQMQTVWVDVVLNGRKVGNYQFCEQIRIDSKRVDIYNWEDASKDCAKAIAKKEGLSNDVRDEMEEAMNTNLSWISSNQFKFNGKVYKVSDYYEVKDINGGYLLEMDEYFDEVSKFKTKSGQPIMFNTPEFAKTNTAMMNYVQTYLQAFEDAIANHDSHSVVYQGDNVHYTDLFDMDSLIDFWLLQEFFFNEDGMKKSTYLYKDMDDKFHMGPIWDMDWAANGEGNTHAYNQWQTEFFNTNAQAKQWYKDLIRDPYFVMKAQQRYWEIHELLNDIVKTNGKIDTYQSYLASSAASNDSIWNKTGAFNNNVNGLKTWMKNRLNWLDTQFATKTSILNSFHIEQNNNLDVVLKDKNGNHLDKDNSSAPTAADALLPYGSTLNIRVNDNNADKVNLYVNGRMVKTSDLHSTEFMLAYEDIFKANERSVVEVRTYAKSEQINSRVLIIKTKVVAESLSITTPVKMVYELNDMFDPTGMKVIANMSDGTTKEITDYTLSGFNSSTPGEKTIHITWQGLEASFTITVRDTANKGYLKTMIDHMNTVIDDKRKYKQDNAWLKFVDALTTANKTWLNDLATQEQVNQVLLALAEAYEDIRLIPDETLLENLQSFINKIKAIDIIRYQNEQLNHIKMVYDKAIALQNSFAADSYYALEPAMIAVTNLIDEIQDTSKFMKPDKKEPIETMVTPNNKPTNGKVNDTTMKQLNPKHIVSNSVNTADVNRPAMWFAMLLTGGSLILIYMKKRKYENKKGKKSR